MATRLRILAPLIFGAMIVTCGDSSPAGSAPPNEMDVHVGDNVGEVLDRAMRDYSIAFEWKQGVPGNGRGQFFWRTNESTTRWDAVPYAAGDGAMQGVFVTLARAVELQPLPTDVYSCSWNVTDASGAKSYCTADWLAGGPASIIERSRSEPVVALRKDRKIGDMKAKCFDSQRRVTFCVDSTTGLPLYVRAEVDGQVQEIVATRVEGAGTLASRAELESRLAEGRGEPQVPDLDLPQRLELDR